MPIDIDDLIQKQNNQEQTERTRFIPSKQKLSAEEWNRLCLAVKENQSSVKSILLNGRSYVPDDTGNVVISDNNPYKIIVDSSQIAAIPDIVRDTNIVVGIKARSIKVDETGEIELLESLLLKLEVLVSGTQNTWRTYEFRFNSNSTEYYMIDLSQYLLVGENTLRFQVIGDNAESDKIGKTINVVNLQLYANNTFEIPLSNELVLNYLIGGAVAKTLYIEIGSGHGTSFVLAYGTHISIGDYVNLTTGRNFTFENAPASIMTEGIHTVRAYLQADVDSSIVTDVVESQYMVRDSQGTTPDMVIVNNVNNVLDNYTDVTFFNYAVHTDNESLNVIFKLRDSVSGILLNSWQFLARNNTRYTFTTDLSLELDAEVQYANMYIEDENGNQLSDRIFFTINNESKYSPVSGAEFILSPANRSNDEQNPKTVVNAANGQLVPSTWEGFDMESDGYMAVNKDVDSTSASAEKVRALHIPANRRLTISYNPLHEFINDAGAATALTGKSMTLEIDFRAYNVLDEEEAIIKIGTEHPDGDIYGFEMRPLEACLLTKNVRVRDDQNVSWSEGQRTRLTLNILYGLNPDNDPTRQVNYNYVRMFIDDKIEREFFYEVNDSLLSGNVNLIIGAVSSDIDIFGIRCYQKALSTNDVMQDYVSGLSTSFDKNQWKIKNNILGDDDAISFAKALAAGYNVIGHTGHLPKYGDQNKGKTKNIKLYIGIAGDSKRSGTLTGLEGSGQGTTAMTYYDWNQQYKITDTTTWEPDEPDEEHSGKYDFGTNGYAIANGEAFAKKLVGKINFASSQQGHKLGLTWAYTDLFKELVRRGNISKPGQMTLQSNARISVFEKPFLFFHRESDGDQWKFNYLMTFGAGKGDKPTFGFNKSTTPNMMMVEGADNDVPLSLFAIPWDDKVTYDASNEAWYYNNRKNINFGFGKTVDVNGVEYPEENDGFYAIKDFFNFVYFHNVYVIKYYNGTLEQLRNNTPRPQQDASGNVEPSTDFVYWITDEANRYELYRHDGANGWIPAGSNGEVIDVRSMYEEYCSDLGTTPSSWTIGQWNDIANSLKYTFTQHFRETASNYIHVDDALYHSCFIKLFAGTDNRAKNTYYYSDPVTLKIRFEQDDLDTTIKTNNVGQNRKPYYVEEHDKNSAGAFYWQGENNGFYNLLETAFESEMTAMMNNLFTAMAAISGSVMQFMLDYVLYAQDYFPGVAFNEMTRLVYERAAVAQNDGIYVNNNARAITQANGSQRWSEYQWLKDRIMYLSSWCEFGEFAGSSDASGALGFRGAGATAGNPNTYTFILKPAKWLYPRISQGESNLDASNQSRRVRVQAGQSFTYKSFSLASDSAIAIKGINYYLELGDMNIPLSIDQTSFSFNGKKLQKITINPTGEDNNLFITQNIAIGNAVNIKEFIARGVTTLRNNIDLSKCVRLENIDIRESSVLSVSLPKSAALSSIKYPEYIQAINIVDKPNLNTIIIDGTDNLESVVLRNTSNIVAKYIISILQNLTSE